ncbi:MAG: NAD(P)H-hydrate dehydratase [Bryobacteraceae bacterium]
MKIITTAQSREADRITIERGTPANVLMERAGSCLYEFIERTFHPLWEQRVAIFCGKGNNGGDGLVLARMLDGRVASLQVVLAEDVAMNHPDRDATIVVDALLGTGFREPVQGRYAELIRCINEDFPAAKIIAVDIPSAMRVRADFTVTFGAPKAEMVLSPLAHTAGAIEVADIGLVPDALESKLELSEARGFRKMLAPRAADAHKGNFGHVLVVGGAAGKTGAATMTGLAAARMGAGLTTVACSEPSRLAPELMSAPLHRAVSGRLTLDASALERISVLAVGPGLGLERELVAQLMRDAKMPMVVDADGLNSIAGSEFQGRGVETVLTPHPGEMARLLGEPVRDRVEAARLFAASRNVCVVLKGFRTLIAVPDGRVWINPTGSPALAKGGSGDVLTGMIAGMIAQFPKDIITAVRAAVWLHGRTGELGAEELTESGVLATDLLRYLPNAIRECRG